MIPRSSIPAAVCAIFLAFLPASAGTAVQKLTAHVGTTPVLDGILGTAEWADADSFSGFSEWHDECGANADTDPRVRGFVKHDATALFFAFDVTDSMIYGIDTKRWVPTVNPRTHDLTREGWPWFGDAIEIMCDPRNVVSSEAKVEGRDYAWQMVVNSTKSRRGGVGKGGLLEGEPRTDSLAWNRYVQWIKENAMEAAVRIKSPQQGRGYVVEWKILANPCLQISSGQFVNIAVDGDTIGLNLEIEDADRAVDAGGGDCAVFGLRHVYNWIHGNKYLRRDWGSLVLDPGPRERD